MKKATKKRIYLWGGSFIGLAVLLWGLSTLSGGYDSGTFTAEPLDLTSTAEFEHSKGPEDAAVTVIEYSDFQCPFCAQASPVVDQIAADYPDTVRVVYRHFPLRQIHPQSQQAAEAAEAAARQGAFWEMHDILFANQAQWAGNLGASKIFETYVEALELDVEQYRVDIKDKALTQKVNNDYSSGVRANVQSTPSFFVNGVALQAGSYQAFVEAIDAELERLGVEQSVDEEEAIEESTDEE